MLVHYQQESARVILYQDDPENADDQLRRDIHTQSAVASGVVRSIRAFYQRVDVNDIDAGAFPAVFQGAAAPGTAALLTALASTRRCRRLLQGYACDNIATYKDEGAAGTVKRWSGTVGYAWTKIESCHVHDSPSNLVNLFGNSDEDDEEPARSVEKGATARGGGSSQTAADDDVMYVGPSRPPTGADKLVLALTGDNVAERTKALRFLARVCGADDEPLDPATDDERQALARKLRRAERGSGRRRRNQRRRRGGPQVA